MIVKEEEQVLKRIGTQVASSRDILSASSMIHEETDIHGRLTLN